MNLFYSQQSLQGIAATRDESGGDRYIVWLGLALLGYTTLSRGFAYWGLPPIFVGELFLLWGVYQAMRSRALDVAILNPIGLLLASILLLTALRTLQGFGEYGLDAIRDAMQLGYGVFAFIVAALLIAKPERLKLMISAYRKYVVVVLATVWVVYLIFKGFESSVPYLPWADNARIFEAKGGDIMVQLAGIATFMMVGLMRTRPLLVFALAVNASIIMVSNRGGMVAFFLALTVGYFLRPPEARIGKMAYAFALILIVGVMVGPMLPVNGGTRTISVDQIWTNIKSVVGQSDSESLEGTKKWRMEWWESIYDYTVRGEYFWSGKGFGINLAKSDGFLVDPALRSPHNGHMTVLARMGVPGALLWILLQLAWFGTMTRAWWRARESRSSRWMAVFAVLISYAVAMHINAAFDVYFEGPMGGIWFWTVFGVGIGAAWIHRHQPELLDDNIDHITSTNGTQSIAQDARAIPPTREVRWGWPSAPRPASP